MQATFLTTTLLPSALFVIMLGLGLSLTADDFLRLFRSPKAVLTGLAVQMVLLPLCAWLIVLAVPSTPAIALGLIALALCPGGPTATLITHLSKGDTALSITLTAITSVATVFTVPLVLGPAAAALLGSTSTVSLPAGQSFVQLVAVTLLPAGIGMAIRAKAEGLAKASEKAVKIVSAVFLAAVILAVLAREWNALPGFFVQAGAMVLLLNAAALALGLGAGRLLRLNQAESTCLAVDTAICNGTLAIFITAGLLKNEEASVPAALYSLIMFFTAAGLGWWSAKRTPDLQPAPAEA